MIIKNILVNPANFPIGETNLELRYVASGFDAGPGGRQTITIDGGSSVLFLDENGNAKEALSSVVDFTTDEKEYSIKTKIKVTPSAKTLNSFFIKLEIVGNGNPRTKSSETLTHE